MENDFDPYALLIGKELNSIHLMKASMSFEFCDPKDRHVRNEINIATMADLCVLEEDIFKPANEYDIIRSDNLSKIYDVLGKPVLDFKPLNKKRVCLMEFENLQIFTWAKDTELPDCLYMAERGRNTKDYEWWLIDDQ